jgi:hypothetical protein
VLRAPLRRAAEVLIGVFSAGWSVSVSFKKNNKLPDIERLENEDEVWAFCIRKPPPGWRLLGRMIDKDIFVALRAYDKCELVKNYAAAAAQVRVDWDGLFGVIPPFRGGVVSDYLSNVRDLDEKDG